MLEVVFQKVNRRDEVVTERKSFKDQAAVDRWFKKMDESSSFVRVLAWSE